MSARLNSHIHPTVSAMVMVLLMFLGGIILQGCRHQSNVPFWIDTRAGTYSFLDGGRQLGPINMELNGRSPLQGSFLFHEEDNLVCINSVNELDIIARFAGNQSEGTLQMQVINTGKENLEIFQLDPLVLNVTMDFTFEIINDKELIIVNSQNQGSITILKVINDQPWDLRFHENGDNLVLSLLLWDNSVVLMPEEKLILPGLNIKPGSSYNPG